jgi:hypothetical protein
MMAVGWAMMLGWQIAEQLASTAATDPGGLLIASALMVLLVLFGAYLAASRKVKSFLKN